MLKSVFGFHVLMDEKGDAPGGGGGTPPPADKPGNEIETLKSQNADLIRRLEALEKSKPAPTDDSDLADKARRSREESDKSNLNQKALESALHFNLRSKEWLADNASLLPKTIEGIFDQAGKENYANAIEKDGAIKAGIISEFFALQSNLDLLTPSQKFALEEFTKLTKNVKQERAQSIYDTIFEPTFEALKRIKKAEHRAKGLADPSNAEAAYKEKMIGLSRKHYLGEKT